MWWDSLHLVVRFTNNWWWYFEQTEERSDLASLWDREWGVDRQKCILAYAHTGICAHTCCAVYLYKRMRMLFLQERALYMYTHVYNFLSISICVCKAIVHICINTHIHTYVLTYTERCVLIIQCYINVCKYVGIKIYFLHSIMV